MHRNRSYSYTFDGLQFRSSLLNKKLYHWHIGWCRRDIYMMQDENIWKLLARKMKGEATAEELKELEDILKNDPAMRYTAETFSRIWDALSIQQAKGNKDSGIRSTES